MQHQHDMAKITNAAGALRGFVPAVQMAVIGSLCRGEEADFFRGKLVEFAERVAAMPKTYEQDGEGDDAVAYLHYFTGSGDWYITERDMEPDQHQAFGLVNLGYGAELGYISLVELCAIRSMEIDLHFEPTKLSEIKAAKGW